MCRVPGAGCGVPGAGCWLSVWCLWASSAVMRACLHACCCQLSGSVDHPLSIVRLAVSIVCLHRPIDSACSAAAAEPTAEPTSLPFSLQRKQKMFFKISTLWHPATVTIALQRMCMFSTERMQHIHMPANCYPMMGTRCCVT